MKTLQLSLAILAGTISILCVSYHIGFSTDEPTSISDSSMPPIIVTQVELWGPSSFHTDGIIQCEDNETSLGPWAVGWVEIHNTKNDSITISDVDLKGNGWEEGQSPMTLGPQEYCYIVTQNQVSTRIGVGGSLGNGPPPHDNVTTILSYSVQSFDKKMNYTYSAPPLSDDLGDAKTWQLVDGSWIFLDANFKQELFTKTIMSPLEQFRSGISTNDIVCKEGLYLAIKSNNLEPTCLKAGTISKLASRGFFYGINASETTNTTILIPPGSEDQSSNKTYSPDVTTVVLGVNNTVTWVNQADVGNEITPDMPLTQNGQPFASDGIIKPGESYEFTFTEPGTFTYHTEPHPWMKGTIIVLPKPNDIDISTAKSYNLKQVHYYYNSNQNPKVSLYDYSYDGIDKDGLVSIDNQTFYQTTLDNDIYKLKGTSIQFHNVTFSFPEGTLVTPGGAFVNLDVKFQDGFEEIYGGIMSNLDGSGSAGGIPIPTPYGPHLATNSITVLGNHTTPQAGLTIYHDMVKLLVIDDNQTSQTIPQCVSDIQNQYAIAGPRGDILCPVVDFRASGKIVNYTGFYSVYEYPEYTGTPNFVLEPGHNGTLSYEIDIGSIYNWGNQPSVDNVNITNGIEFMHDASMHDHPGIDTPIDSKSEIIQKNNSAFVTITFVATKDARPGTYWVDLPPSFCAGGETIILTVTNCEK